MDFESDKTLKFVIYIFTSTKVSGAYAGFLKGGPNSKIYLDFRYTCRKAACREQRSCEPLQGGLGACSRKKIFKNDTISCVLRAIFNHFPDKKSSQKIINKQEFFHWPFYDAAPH